MPTPIEGRYGRFQVNGSNAYVESFSGEISTDRIDITGWEDQGNTGRVAQRVTDGVDKVRATVKGYVDSDAMPSSFGFTPGTYLSGVFLYLTKRSKTQYINMITAQVFKVNYQANVHDKIMFDLEIESHGPFVQPS